MTRLICFVGEKLSLQLSLNSPPYDFFQQHSLPYIFEIIKIFTFIELSVLYKYTYSA